MRRACQGFRARAGVLALAALGLLAGARPAYADPHLELAQLEHGRATLSKLDRRGVIARGELPADVATPLGSLWKLFVHAYVVDRGLPDPGYTCRGGDPDEVYCCARGERISRDQALIRSCGPYYAPQRLGIDSGTWRDYWHARDAPDWLQALERMQPASEVRVAELLSVLATLPAQAELRRLLLDRLLEPDLAAALGKIGSRLRMKTFSWHRPHRPNERLGGFAGWRSDGTPVWAAAPGTSRSVLEAYAPALGRALPTTPPSEPGECVQVALFQRYPIGAVTDITGKPAAAGALRGAYTVQFVNGNRLPVDSAGELTLTHDSSGLHLVARLAREDYVARVLEREAAAEPIEAARALAIAIRTYLQQNATQENGCLTIADSSTSQRVAPRPASPAARAIAAWSADLVLAGTPIRYHLDRSDGGRLSWQHAVEQARAGRRFDLILTEAFPRASLARWDRPLARCEPLDQATRWLARQLPRWRQRLFDEPGYDGDTEFTVCRLHGGRPHIDRERRRIYVRGLVSQQDRLDLAHEYLHLAFAAYPSGQDEAYVEALARRLILE